MVRLVGALMLVAAACGRGPTTATTTAPLEARMPPDESPEGTVVASPPRETARGLLVRPSVGPAKVPPTLPVAPRAPLSSTVPIIVLPDPLASASPRDARALETQIAEVRALVASKRGVERLDARLRLVALLEEHAWRDAEGGGFEARIADALAESRRLVEAAGFASYARADEALYRHATLEESGGDRAAAGGALGDLVARHPTSRLAPWAHVRLADRAFDDGDMPRAAQRYDHVLTLPGSAMTAYARYRRAWVHSVVGEHQDALEGFMKLAAGPDPAIAELAGHDVARSYALVGRADRALAFFQRVSPGRELDLAAELAARYADLGRHTDASTVYDLLAASEPDPALACPHLVGAVEVRIPIARRVELLEAADRLVGAHPTGACAIAADALLGMLAWAWHTELPKSRADPRQVARAWELALAVASSPARASVMTRNLAELRWDIAYPVGTPADWTDAGDAFLAAAARDRDPALASAAVDAFDNALRVARARDSLPPPVAMRIRAGLGRVTGPERARADALAASASRAQ